MRNRKIRFLVALLLAEQLSSQTVFKDLSTPDGTSFLDIGNKFVGPGIFSITRSIDSRNRAIDFSVLPKSTVVGAGTTIKTTGDMMSQVGGDGVLEIESGRLTTDVLPLNVMVDGELVYTGSSTAFSNVFGRGTVSTAFTSSSSNQSTFSVTALNNVGKWNILSQNISTATLPPLTSIAKKAILTTTGNIADASFPYGVIGLGQWTINSGTTAIVNRLPSQLKILGTLRFVGGAFPYNESILSASTGTLETTKNVSIDFDLTHCANWNIVSGNSTINSESLPSNLSIQMNSKLTYVIKNGGKTFSNTDNITGDGTLLITTPGAFVLQNFGSALQCQKIDLEASIVSVNTFDSTCNIFVDSLSELAITSATTLSSLILQNKLTLNNLLTVNNLTVYLSSVIPNLTSTTSPFPSFFSITGNLILPDVTNTVATWYSALIGSIGSGAKLTTSCLRAGRSSSTFSVVAGNGESGFINDRGIKAQFNKPLGIYVQDPNNIYVADSDNKCIRHVNSNYEVINVLDLSSVTGYNSLTFTSVIWSIVPQALTMDTNNNLYIVDSTHHCVFMINADNFLSGSFKLVAGKYGTSGFNSSSVSGASALFNGPTDITVLYNSTQALPSAQTVNYLYLVDSGNHCIRQISTISPYTVTCLAGSGTSGFLDSPTGTSASFKNPYGLTIFNQNALYVTDSGNNAVRSISLTSPYNVFTIAGGQQGFQNDNALSAKFNAPKGIAIDPLGTLFVADSGNQAVRKIGVGYDVSTVPSVALSNPTGIGTDSLGNIYLTDTGKHNFCLGQYGYLNVAASLSGKSLKWYVGENGVYSTVFVSSLPAGDVTINDDCDLVLTAPNGQISHAIYGSQKTKLITAQTVTVGGSGGDCLANLKNWTIKAGSATLNSTSWPSDNTIINGSSVDTSGVAVSSAGQLTHTNNRIPGTAYIGIVNQYDDPPTNASPTVTPGTVYGTGTLISTNNTNNSTCYLIIKDALSNLKNWKIRTGFYMDLVRSLPYGNIVIDKSSTLFFTGTSVPEKTVISGEGTFECNAQENSQKNLLDLKSSLSGGIGLLRITDRAKVKSLYLPNASLYISPGSTFSYEGKTVSRKLAATLTGDDSLIGTFNFKMTDSVDAGSMFIGSSGPGNKTFNLTFPSSTSLGTQPVFSLSKLPKATINFLNIPTTGGVFDASYAILTTSISLPSNLQFKIGTISVLEGSIGSVTMANNTSLYFGSPDGSISRSINPSLMLTMSGSVTIAGISNVGNTVVFNSTSKTTTTTYSKNVINGNFLPLGVTAQPSRITLKNVCIDYNTRTPSNLNENLTAPIYIYEKVALIAPYGDHTWRAGYNKGKFEFFGSTPFLGKGDLYLNAGSTFVLFINSLAAYPVIYNNIHVLGNAIIYISGEIQKNTEPWIIKYTASTSEQNLSSVTVPGVTIIPAHNAFNASPWFIKIAPGATLDIYVQAW